MARLEPGLRRSWQGCPAHGLFLSGLLLQALQEGLPEARVRLSTALRHPFYHINKKSLLNKFSLYLLSGLCPVWSACCGEVFLSTLYLPQRHTSTGQAQKARLSLTVVRVPRLQRALARPHKRLMNSLDGRQRLVTKDNNSLPSSLRF